MAVVYAYVNGMKITELIARTREAQNGVSAAARRVAAEADVGLAQHHQEGHAAIEIEDADIDRLVVLTDERGLGAAMSMEYGRDEGTTSSWGPMRPLWILHRAADLPTGG